MAATMMEDGVIPQPTANGGGISFDTQVFRTYLETLLQPGEQCSAAREICTNAI